MGKKIDVRSLIKEKYKDNTFELSDLEQEIDLVLNEGITDYTYKRDTSTLEEDPRQSIKAANSVNGNSVSFEFGAPRNERPDSDQKKWYHADKIAEVNVLSESPGGKSVTVSVPDIFSLITNKEMKIGSDDRIIIDNIIQSATGIQQGGSWIQRIKAFDNFVNKNTVDFDQGSFREVISKLIMLNVLQKISLFTADPGKLFEYIIAPIIGPGVEVLGATNQKIIDVQDTHGSGGRWSIKFFTAESSDLEVKGSRVNLTDFFNKEKVNTVNYIISRVNSDDNHIEFLPLILSSDETVFTNNGYDLIKELGQGKIYFHQSNGAGIFVKDKTATQFEIPLKGVWNRFKPIRMNLGKPEEYNKQQIKVANTINKVIVNTLNDFSDLGKYITIYFTNPNEGMTGQQAINCSNRITNNIVNIGRSEGKNFKI